MPFPADAVGLDLAPLPRTIATRDILAYAAGLGASEATFLDDASDRGVSALPFLCVSLEWPVLLSSRAHVAGRLSEEEARRGVHAIQDSTFHRPICAGDDLETSGQLVVARSVRAGVLTTHKLSTRDRRTGDMVTTSWTSSIYRGIALQGDNSTIEEPPAPPVPLLDPLDGRAATHAIPIMREAPHIYTECAGIWNPIHTERTVALAAGLPDIILHGTATWALAGLEILRSHAASDIARLKRFSGRFVGMVIPGETIQVRHAPDQANKNVIRFDVRAQNGATVIDQGFAVLG